MASSDRHKQQACMEFDAGFCHFGDNCHFLHFRDPSSQQQTRGRTHLEVLIIKSADQFQGHGTPPASHSKPDPAPAPGPPVDWVLPTMQIENEEPRLVSLAAFHDDYCALNGYRKSHSGPSRKEVIRAYKKVFKTLLGDKPPLLQICLDQLRTPEAQEVFNITSPTGDIGSYLWRPSSDGNIDILKTRGLSQLVHDNGSTIIIPYYGAAILENLNFVDFCQEVRDYNDNCTNLSEAALRYVFKCIIHNIYFFEKEATKSAVEGQLKAESTIKYWESDEPEAAEAAHNDENSITEDPCISGAKRYLKREALSSDSGSPIHSADQKAKSATVTTVPTNSLAKHTSNLHDPNPPLLSMENSESRKPQPSMSEDGARFQIKRLEYGAAMLEMEHGSTQPEISKLEQPNSKARLPECLREQGNLDTSESKVMLDVYYAATQIMLDAQLGVFH